MSEIRRAGVVGCGRIGAGIAEVCARSGFDVVVAVRRDEAAAAGRERIAASLRQAVRRGVLDEAGAEEALRRVDFTTDLTALAECEIVVEAIVEDLGSKRAVFEALDRLTPATAVLTSTTSSIPIRHLVAGLSTPERVLGSHFFNPVPVSDLVEIIPATTTAPEAADRTEAFALALGKQVIRSRDQAGFVVSGLLIPYLCAAIRMLEAGVANADDIDVGMVEGCMHPMGPLHVADFIGLDVVLAIAESLHEEFGESHFEPPKTLRDLVAAGDLGRKSGRGFFDYSDATR